MVTSADVLLPAESGDADAKAEGAAALATAQDRDELAGVWRLLRRLGVAEADVDDATQQVLLVAIERQTSIRPGRRRAFLYGTALRVAREVARRRQPSVDVDEHEMPDIELPHTEDLVERHRARELLDELLERMPFDLRAVFVLFEIEELSTKEIAQVLELPRGTVASRLRRAREDFTARLTRLEAKRPGRGGHK
ncbi:MAG: sigma-70 family RNA polymerase sigma factor [Myxococcales bacterium]|nr:sigma-70 family RNA polymerase sigma factor [Myxococcales bacterium]